MQPPPPPFTCAPLSECAAAASCQLVMRGNIDIKNSSRYTKTCIPFSISASKELNKQRASQPVSDVGVCRGKKNDVCQARQTHSHTGRARGLAACAANTSSPAFAPRPARLSKMIQANAALFIAAGARNFRLLPTHLVGFHTPQSNILSLGISTCRHQRCG
jgi:hypothetical protein